MIKYYSKFLIIAIICGVVNCAALVSPEGTQILLSDIILKFGYQDFYIYSPYLVLIFERYFPIIVFQIIWGTFIYRNFCTASVYVFSRRGNRAQWFIKEAANLYVYILTYLTLLLGAGLLFTTLTCGITIDPGSIQLMGYYFILQSLWLFAMTLLINIFAIAIGSVSSTSIIVGIQILFITLFIVFERLNIFTYEFETGVVAEKSLQMLLIKLNPFSHIILKYHSSVDKNLDSLINEYGFYFDINLSVAVLIMLACISIIIGAIVVTKVELITIDREKEGR